MRNEPTTSRRSKSNSACLHQTQSGSEIMMGAGVLVVILGIFLIPRKRQSMATTRISNDPLSGNQITQRERRGDAA